MENIDVKDQFITMRAKGNSLEKCAKKLDKSKNTVLIWNKDFEEEIANRRNIELEALNERFFLAKQRKLSLFGGILKRITDELEGRDLHDVPTDKLMDLLLKYYALLETEEIEPRFKSESDIKEIKAEKEILNRLLDEPARLKVG